MDSPLAGDASKRAYQIIEGKGHAVCKAYLRNLRGFSYSERDPVCNPRPHSGSASFSEPEWRPMDVRRHVRMIYEAEMSWGIHLYHPERHPPYAEWKERFEADTSAGRIEPSLKHAVVEFVPGSPIDVVAYARNPAACESEFARDGASDNTGHRWFFYDKEKGTLRRSLGSELAGAILLFGKQPVFVVTTPTAEEIILWEQIRTFRTFSPAPRCRYDVDDPTKPASMLKWRRMDPR
jgi:hypothetical protein